MFHDQQRQMVESDYEAKSASAPRAMSPLDEAFDALHSAIGEMDLELAVFTERLTPVTRDEAEVRGIGVDPTEGRTTQSSTVYAIRLAAQRLGMQRAHLDELRARLDI